MRAPSDSSPAPVARTSRFSLSYLTVPLAVLAVIVLVLELIPVNVYILLPGQALPVGPMISVKGYPPKRTAGRLYMVDVSLFKANRLLEELIYSRLQNGAEVEQAKTVTGGLSDTQYNRLNVQLMGDSIRQAEVAALRQVPGLQPRPAKTGPRILYILPSVPAARVLRAGDVILAVDGTRVRRATAVGALIRAHRAGQTVRLRILRRSRRLTVRVRTVAATNGVPTKRGKTALLGIYSEDQFTLPVKISIAPGNIGGPSAGLMFSLGVIQRLERRDLTRGCAIAGTGTIDGAGNVGPIGGARQKVIAAESRGAKYFFVPDVPENVRPARRAGGGITIVPVRTLAQALRYLATITPCR